MCWAQGFLGHGWGGLQGLGSKAGPRGDSKDQCSGDQNCTRPLLGYEECLSFWVPVGVGNGTERELTVLLKDRCPRPH